MQSRQIIPLIPVLGLVAAGLAGANEEPVTTLAQLVRSALVTHESVARAESDLRRAEADVRLSRAILLPQLHLSAGLTRYQEALAVEFSPGESFVIRPLTDLSYSADLRQTLFYGLRDWRARKVARLWREASELELLAVRADLILEVSHAFFEAVAAAEQREVRAAAVELATAQLRVAERRFEVGEVTTADVARWRARWKAEEQALVEIEGRIELARRRLARLTGVDELGRLERLAEVPVPAAEADQDLTARALAARPELVVVRRQLAAAELMVRIEKGAWLPELNAHLQYYVQRSEFPSQDWVSLNLSLVVPVYDGGRTASRVAKADEDLCQLELFERQLVKAIGDQVDAAAVAWRTATAALEAARERHAAAREAERQTERAYRVGEASATDLLTAGSDLADAATAEVVARWQRQLQAIALRHAVGEPPVPGVELDNDRDE